MYDYEKEKPEILTDRGQCCLLATYDAALKLTASGRRVFMDELLKEADNMGSYMPSDWAQMALVDHLVKLGKLRELTPGGSGVPQQGRYFVRG